MNQEAYVIKFDEASIAKASQHANELRDVLLAATPDISVDRRRDDPHTQDFGSTLVLVLGTSSVTIIAKAIGDWLQLRNSASLTIETPEKKIIATNIKSKDATKLAELLLKK